MFLEKDKILGTIFNEILYAVDTIIYSKSAKTLTKLLEAIHTEGEKYGLKLNQEKCEAITVRAEYSETTDVFFKNGSLVKQMKESKYLGCFLNNETDLKREIKPCTKYVSKPNDLYVPI